MILWFRQQRQQIPELQFDKFPDPQSFLVWKNSIQESSDYCSDFPSDAMLWVNEVEMVDSLDELKSSRSVCGKGFPKLRDAGRKDCFCSEQKIIQNSQLKKKVSLEEQKSPERGSVSTRETDRLHDVRLLSSDGRS